MSLSGKPIAILGATSHIAMGLIDGFSADPEQELFLFARSPERVAQFLEPAGGRGASARVLPFRAFAGAGDYRAVLNCVGLGRPSRLKRELPGIFELTERFDAMVLDYLRRHPATLYVSLSSGAAYGTDFSSPAGERSEARFPANGLDPSQYYGLAKLYSEAKHRSLPELNIVDLRVFGYFSRHIDLEEKFLLSEMVGALVRGEEFVTGPGDITRDFVHPEDLVALIRLLLQRGRINDVFDVYSAAPATKFQIIDLLARWGGLRCRVSAGHAALTVTGTKSNYYSENRRAGGIGYLPRFSSLECIRVETEAILARHGRSPGETGSLLRGPG